MSKEDEIKKIIDYVGQAVWTGKHNDSEGYIIDLENINDLIEITGTIEEPTNECFTVETHFIVDKNKSSKEQAIKKYLEMGKPYVFNRIEYKNLIKLPDHTQKLFLDNLLEIEDKIGKTKHSKLGANDTRVVLFKKENDKKKIYSELETIEKEYINISAKKETNIITINESIEKIKKNNEIFRPINIINKVLGRTENQEELKSNAVKLEKENLKLTEQIFEKLIQKNDLKQKLKELELEVSVLREQYQAEDKNIEKETDILKEKNMLFKVFKIDLEESQEIEINEIQEESE